MSDDYEVGYKKPPKRTRFRKGQSGNPNGRPKARRTAADHLLAILNQKITVREGQAVRRMTCMQAILLSLRNRALKGDDTAIRMLLTLAKESGQFEPAEDENVPFAILRVPFRAETSEEWAAACAPLAIKNDRKSRDMQD